MSQANTAGNTKKTIQYSILYIGYAVGNLIGPQTFREDQAPAYTGGFIAMLICYCVCVLLMAGYWTLGVGLNRRGVVDPDGVRDDDGFVDGEAFGDKTDFEQRGFKYTT